MPEEGYEYFFDIETGEEFAVQKSTGEITEAVTVTVPCGTYFKTPEQQAADRRKREGLKKRLENEEQRRQKNNDLKELGKYIFAVCNDYSDLSDAAVARLVFLATFLSYDNGKLYKTERTPLREEDLPGLMNLNLKTVRKFLKETRNYIEVGEDKGLKMVGYAFYRGNLPKGQYIEMQRLYRDSIRNLYNRTPAGKHPLLGVVFRLLPYVNQEYNILCHNPSEKSLDDLDLLSLNDFCKLIGHDYRKMYRLRADLKKLTFNVNGKRELFCSFVDAGLGTKHIRIFVNPHILYNGSDYKRVEVLGKFCEL